MRKHYAAVKARLEAAAVLTGRVHSAMAFAADGKPIRTAYVILYGGGPDDLDDDRFTAAQSVDSTAEYVYPVRAVGPTADSALATASVAFAQLVGAKLTVTGRRLDAIRHTFSRPVEMDDSVKPPLFYCDDEYTLVSRRP